MANAAAKVRFVRCPKCLNVLPEFDAVPMYQCGACGAVLRAKNYKMGKEGASSGSHSANPCQNNVSDTESFNDGSTCSMKSDLPSTIHVEEQNSICGDCSSPAQETHCEEKGEISDAHEEKKISGTVVQDKSSDAASSSHAFSDKEDNEKKQFEDHLLQNPSSQDSDMLRSNSTKFEESTVASEEEILAKQSSHLSSPAAASDDAQHNQIHESYQLPGSGSSKADKRSQMRREALSGRRTRQQTRMTSLGSESFYSVKSRMESMKEGPSASLSRGSSYSESNSSKYQNISPSTKLKSINHKRVELLKLVEELTDQLAGSRELKEENQQRSQFSAAQHLMRREHHHRSHQQQYQSLEMPSSYHHCHLRPYLCCNNRSCRTCTYNVCCHSSIQEASSNLYSNRQKARLSKRFCRPVSGGAPFVVCYKCFELLQMPADFLISTRRLNKLRCGACSETLALPFPARDHEVPQASSEENASSSDNYPTSFTEEYSVSFAESCSTETEPAANVSRAGSSKSSRNEKDFGSSLHQLMGYPSARILLH